MAECAKDINMKKGTTKEVFTRQSALKDHNWTAGEFKEFSFAANSITGFRLDQEDRYTCLPNPRFTKSWSFFGVYDGHAGTVVAEYLKRKLHHHIMEQLEEFGDIRTAIDLGFFACDSAIKTIKEDEFNEMKDAALKEFSESEYKPSTTGATNICMSERLYAEIQNQFLQYIIEIQARKDSQKKNDESEVRRSKRLKNGKKAEDEKKNEEIPLVGLSAGSTATAVVFTDDTLYVANVGDSLCIASVKGELVVLTEKHVPKMKEEKERILKAGHNITSERVDGILNMSRCFGGFKFKDNKNLMQREQAISVEPSISSVKLDDVDFVVIASDGIWDEMEAFEVHDFVVRSLYLPIEEIISEMFDIILLHNHHKRGLDNMTLIIIKSNLRCVKVSKEFLNSTDTDDNVSEASKSKTKAKKGKRFKK